MCVVSQDRRLGNWSFVEFVSQVIIFWDKIWIGNNIYADYNFNFRNKPFDPKEFQPEMVNMPKE